jgi:pantoate--beta-alanine ligase
MVPQVIETISEMSALASGWKVSVGFVPTMGFLHAGHLSLVKASQKENKITVVSIYVNPSQFSPTEDLSQYPRDLERDIELLAEMKVDYIFFPDDAEMYPSSFKTWISVKDITQIMCGKSRPSHFKGVTTIVCKLLNIVKPDSIFLGEKDFQQLMVIKTMVRDLNITVKVTGCPIFREEDGLAMSSRNKFLQGKWREKALCLYNSLQLAQKLYSDGIKDVDVIRNRMEDLIVQEGGLVDYIEFINSSSLELTDKLDSGCRAAVAVKINKTRLIDNLQII